MVKIKIPHKLFKLIVRPKKKNCYVALTRPKFENWVGRSDFFYIFFLRTVRELSFPIFFLKFLNGENSGGMQSKRIYKCFFKPLNTNFSKFFAQIWHFHTQKKKSRPCFFAFYGRSGEGNITIFFLALCLRNLQLGCMEMYSVTYYSKTVFNRLTLSSDGCVSIFLAPLILMATYFQNLGWRNELVLFGNQSLLSAVS